MCVCVCAPSVLMSQSESKQQEERERGGGRWGRTELRREGKGGQETANETDSENRSFNASAKQMTVNGKTMGENNELLSVSRTQRRS